MAKLCWFLELKALFCTDEVDKIDVELFRAPHLCEEFSLAGDDLLHLNMREFNNHSDLAETWLRLPETFDVV